MGHNQNENRKPGLGPKLTAKWFSAVPKSLRYLLVFSGLLALMYFGNKGIWF